MVPCVGRVIECVRVCVRGRLEIDAPIGHLDDLLSDQSDLVRCLLEFHGQQHEPALCIA